MKRARMRRIRLSNDEFYALSLLADAEEVPWFHEKNRKSVDIGDLDCLAESFWLPQAEYIWKHETRCDTDQPLEVHDINGKKYKSHVDLILSIFDREKIEYDSKEIYDQRVEEHK